VDETAEELAAVAEVCTAVVTDAWLADCTRRWGEPGCGFAVLGMGKFGGRELNYSSDIDVIFFYEEVGDVKPGFTRQEFFGRVCEKIVETFSAPDEAGPLFRIDLRLRPEGGSGPLVRSLDSMENYYAAFGETWERMALSKGRVVAGSEELGYDLSRRLQAFVYPRVVSPDMLDEVAYIKRRIEREIVGDAALHRNVKLGYGGIREIEFVCQTLQLLHGARHAFLQEKTTVRSLAGLRELRLLPEDECDALLAAYRFLRTVEHRLQIREEAQTHDLPTGEEEQGRLAASLGFPGYSEFMLALGGHTARVRKVFEATLGKSGAESGTRDQDEVQATDVAFFRAPEAAAKALREVGGGGGATLISPRTKRLFQRLEPLLLAHLKGVADPDGALTRFARFAERYGLRGALFETLLVNPRVLELLVKLFDASPFLSEFAIRRPQSIEEVARGGSLSGVRTLGEYCAALARNEEGLPWEDGLRVVRRAELLRIALRDLLGFATPQEVRAEYSTLAEACVRFAAERLGGLPELTVVALGKFGGAELGYGADLDVLFLGNASDAARELTRAMTAVTGEGRVFPMDARLRPEGEAGPLAVPLSGWCDYFARGRGELWEAQALTKARPLFGPDIEAFAREARKVWEQFGRMPDLRERVGAMLGRVARARGGDPLLDFKTGPGGLMHLEFYTQVMQMQHAVWEPNTIRALEMLKERGVVSAEVEARLIGALEELRRAEMVLRRAEDKSVSRLPERAEEQRALALRMGYSSIESWRMAHEAARATITELAPF
jgi:glutamate-ammonia-ligase adenylyltransferase